ncbi:MAG TPA: hypothetical protein VF283_23370 [Bryobacteraceae bacterium]
MKKKRILTALCVCACAVHLWAADDTNAAPGTSGKDITVLRAQIAAQQREIEKLQKSIADQQKVLERISAHAPAADGVNVNKPVAYRTGTVPADSNSADSGQRPQHKPSPLSISIGNTTFKPFGFIDATIFGRSSNVGSGIGTNFGSIPFNNSVAGHLSENSFSTQNSRIGFEVKSNYHGADILGHFEADFLGNQPGNVFVTSNANTFRMRNVFIDVRKGIFEVLGGQDWSLATPNKTGLSPEPSDIFYTQNMDTNYQAGLVWSRQTQFRFVLHPNDNFAVGLSLENPQQYIGGSGGLSATAVTLPSALASTLGSQFNNGGSSYSAPNLHPDIIVKAAYDVHPGGKHLHFEAASLTRSFKDAFASTSGSYQSNSLTTESGEVNANLEVVKVLHLIANTFFGSGNGRYVFGLAPDVIVRADGTLSPVHTFSTVDGFEANVSKNLLLYAYYGGVDVGKNVAIDTNGKLIGYGFAGSSSGDNRTIQEGTIGLVPTFWKSKNYGALSMILQYSYLSRDPWSIATGAPKNAHTNMYWIDLRYTIP